MDTTEWIERLETLRTPRVCTSSRQILQEHDESHQCYMDTRLASVPVNSITGPQTRCNKLTVESLRPQLMQTRE